MFYTRLVVLWLCYVIKHLKPDVLTRTSYVRYLHYCIVATYLVFVFIHVPIIKELVDSLCKDGTDMQYWSKSHTTHYKYTYSTLLVTSHCALCRKDSLCEVHGLCISRKGGTGGGGWGHPQGDVHMVAARLCFERAMVGTGWATPCPDCMARLREHHSHLVGGWFLARKAA